MDLEGSKIFLLIKGEITLSLNNPLDANPFSINISSLEITILLDFNIIFYSNYTNKDPLARFLLMFGTYCMSRRIILFF